MSQNVRHFQCQLDMSEKHALRRTLFAYGRRAEQNQQEGQAVMSGGADHLGEGATY